MALRRRRWLSRTTYILFLLALALATGEIFMRLTGRSPWTRPEKTISIEPGDSFFRPHPVYGYAGQPGTLHVTLQDTLQFTVSHNEDGYRRCAPPLDSVDARPQVWVFGCSFTHGYGVEDDAAYPWLLQKRFPQYQFRNFAMTGYGTYHSLLQLQEELKKGPRPALAILAYGAFHDQRNVNSRYWQKALAGQEVAEDIQYPFVRLNEKGQLQSQMENPRYESWPLQEWSALVHFFEKQSNGAHEKELESYRVTQMLIDSIGNTCTADSVPLLLAGIFKNEGTNQMLANFAGKMDTIDIAQDTEDPALRILPDDGHPNTEGHRRMAKILVDRLVNLFDTSSGR